MDSDDGIEVVEHDPSWKDLFRSESLGLEGAMGDLALSIEHIGSTAVPGLAAKPVVDIMACVDRQRGPDDYLERLSDLGYRYVEQEDEPDRIFFVKGSPRTHHLHLVVHGSAIYWEHLMFRDHLLENEEALREYASLKRELASRFRDDRGSYSRGKREFIERTVALSRSTRERF